jgi:Na+-transporting methylmalonyl-CoA/oxaloacetate decarboxylase gamma subunit
MYAKIAIEIAFLLIVIGFFVIPLLFLSFLVKLVFKLDKTLDRFLDEKKNDKD